MYFFFLTVNKTPSLPRRSWGLKKLSVFPKPTTCNYNKTRAATQIPRLQSCFPSCHSPPGAWLVHGSFNKLRRVEKKDTVRASSFFFFNFVFVFWAFCLFVLIVWLVRDFLFLFLFVYLFWDRVSLCRSGCPGTYSVGHKDPHVFVSQVLRLKTFIITIILGILPQTFFLKKLVMLKNHAWYG